MQFSHAAGILVSYVFKDRECLLIIVISLLFVTARLSRLNGTGVIVTLFVCEFCVARSAERLSARQRRLRRQTLLYLSQRKEVRQGSAYT